MATKVRQVDRKANLVELVQPRLVRFPVIENLGLLGYEKFESSIIEDNYFHIFRRELDNSFVAYYFVGFGDDSSQQNSLELTLIRGQWGDNLESDLKYMLNNLIKENRETSWMTERYGSRVAKVPFIGAVIAYVVGWAAVPQIMSEWTNYFVEQYGIDMFILTPFAGFLAMLGLSRLLPAVGRKFDEIRTRDISDDALKHYYGGLAESELATEIFKAWVYEASVEKPFSEISPEKLGELQQIGLRS